MAEQNPPMSLNDRLRHRRFIQEASSSRPLPEANKSQLPKPKMEESRRLFTTDDREGFGEPNFSGIMDFDSPPTTKTSDGDHLSFDQPSFAGITDFDTPPTNTVDVFEETSLKLKSSSSKNNKKGRNSKDTAANSRAQSANKEDERENAISLNPTEVENLEVKTGDVHDGEDDRVSFAQPSFSGITEFDYSPKKSREISDDVGSKLDCSSSEKKKGNKSSDLAVNSRSNKEDEIESSGDSAIYSNPSEDIPQNMKPKLEKSSKDCRYEYCKPLNEPNCSRSKGFDYLPRETSNNAHDDKDDNALFDQQSANKEAECESSYDCAISSNSPVKERVQKVKLEGRRRLCKVSSTEDDANNHPYFSAITDFDSPVPNDRDEPKYSEIVDLDSPPMKIRDLLNDLSSKLEFMSIEKKKVKVESISDFPIKKESTLSRFEVDGHGDVQEYDSAGSSFSSSPDPLPDLAMKFIAQNPKNEAEAERFADCVDNFKKVNELQKNDQKLVKVEETQKKDQKPKKIEKSVLKEKMIHVSDDDEDPYAILGGAKSSRRAHTTASRIKEHKSIIPVDIPKNSGGGEWVFEDGESIILTGKPSNYTLPGKIAKMLYPHQRTGLRWLWSIHCKGSGGILGDDMGLGKTMQMCSFLAGLFHSGLVKRVLIVAPKTLLSHWIKELTVVGLSEKIKDYYGGCAKARQYELQYIFQDSGILLTTYGIVPNNFKSLRGDSYFRDEGGEDNIVWDYTILDEGHIIKNPSTQRAKSLLEIPSGHRIIISGTPMQNNLKELWALFSFCCPGLLGDKKEFKARYESAILRGNDKNATDREKRIGSTVAKELRERIEPYFLRRLKNEVFLEDEATKSAKISKKNEIIVWLRLTQSQRQLYKAFLNSELVLSSFDGSPLAALTVLKKICDHPYLLTKRAAEDVLEGMETMLNQDDMSILERMALHLAKATDSENFQNLIDNVSCKITFILSLLENLLPEGHNVLIFSQTRKMLNFIQEAIISKGYKFLRIDGTTKISDREKIVNDFQEGEGAPIFLLTSQVGGLGLTLTKADRVIVVDPAWNPSTDNQSVDRAYRIGQKKDVLVYRLMTCGTIEEKIYKMQVFKGGLFKSATEHKEQTRYFSQQDLRELFSLPKEGFDVSVTQRQLDEEHDQHHIMNDSLKNHIEFLKSHDIAGVSHHSLLFSKTAPAPVVDENDVVQRRKETPYVGSTSAIASRERDVDGAEFALNPKDVQTWKKNVSSVSPNKLTESEIRDRIVRLHQTLSNKAMMSRLPDRGDKLKRQIGDLNLELEKISMAESSTETDIIDLDDISGKLQRVHV